MHPMIEEIETDIIIIGGGISGLWTLNRLRAEGYQAILLEANALGAGQTLKSQGIIHGGLKYALTGILSSSSSALENMPNRWKACLNGKGEIDLSKVKILSPDQLLWSTGSLSSDMVSFLASQTLKSHIQKLKKSEYPTVLQHPQFKGQVYRLEELVLDTVSLIQALSQVPQDCIFQANPELVFSNDTSRVSHVLIKKEKQTIKLSAKRFLLTAGEGNEDLVKKTNHLSIAMQRRPLHMVIVKWPENHPFFGHCMDKSINPRITITSHKTSGGHCIWYLGGELAEQGIHRTASEQIDTTKREINDLFPWLNLSKTQWASFLVNRAEAKQPGQKRPDSIFVQSLENLIIAWPTKLALAPLLSDSVLKMLEEQGITSKSEFVNLPVFLEKAPIAIPIWDQLF